MSVVSRLIWLLTGAAWATRSVVAFADPDYWDPVTALDWTAVWLYSVALLLFAPAVLLLGRIAASRSVTTTATVVAIGAVLAGGANALEDGFGVQQLGTLYVVGFLTAWLAVLALAVALQRARFTRLAGLSVLLFVSVLLFTLGGGLLILGGLGALAIVPAWFDHQEPAPSLHPAGGVDG